MANPRQRRKTKSSSRPVKTSNAKNLRKHPALKAPEAVKRAWDKKKTVTQNYAALGLAHTLNIHAPGGSVVAGLTAVNRQGPEIEVGPRIDTSTGIEPDHHMASESVNTNTLPKGVGRIVRDAEGNVLRVEIGGEPLVEDSGSAESDNDEETPWGVPMEDWAADGKEAAEEVNRAQKTQSTSVTEALTKLSASAKKVQRYSSTAEREQLRTLVRRHGDDLEAMSRDRKLNPWQKTAGELGRSIKKAGGIAALSAPVTAVAL